MNKRMNRNRLNIGAYILQPYARTERHVKEIADCGIDFIVCMDNDRPALDLFHKYGVGAIVKGIVPGWWGGNGDNAGTMESVNTVDKYESAAAGFVDHPAIWGIDCGDEPSALDFPYYGKVMEFVDRSFPNQFGYLNLYPNYASVSENTEEQTVNQLGTPTYAEHIKRYCECVPTDYICYDFYMYSRKSKVARHYDNLKIVADACRSTGRSMWIVLQVNSNRENVWMTLNNLRFQAYSAMAFGAENIIWACYTAGWWHNQVLDGNGEKTQQYDKLKAMNAELRTIASDYMRYRRVTTHFVGVDFPYMDRVQQDAIESLSTGIFMDFKADNDAPLLVGEMVSRERDGSVALMVCAADDHCDEAPKSYNMTFRCDNRFVSAIGGQGYVPVTKLENGYYSVPISSNQGILIVAR